MPIPCKHCPHCETCTPTNVGAVCKPVHGMELHVRAERKVGFNPAMYAAYGKSSKPCKPNQGQLVVARHMVEALQDGECPCCHGSWPSPDATACNGCGYRLDEE